MCGTSTITFNPPLPTFAIGWALYLVDKSTGIILQRYPGVYTDKELAEEVVKEFKGIVSEARYMLVILPYDAHWTATRG